MREQTPPVTPAPEPRRAAPGPFVSFCLPAVLAFAAIFLDAAAPVIWWAKFAWTVLLLGVAFFLVLNWLDRDRAA